MDIAAARVPDLRFDIAHEGQAWQGPRPTRPALIPRVAPRACLPGLWGWSADGGVMSRAAVLTDAQWQLIEPMMPSSDGKQGNQFRDHRQVVEGIIYRFRSGLAWRDLPGEFGPWQTVWKRHRRFIADGTWDRIH